MRKRGAGYDNLRGLKSPATNECRNIRRLIVIPAKAGIQGAKATAVALGPRFREGDDTLLTMLMSFRVGLYGLVNARSAVMINIVMP
jgi:hypothetical protein